MFSAFLGKRHIKAFSAFSAFNLFLSPTLGDLQGFDKAFMISISDAQSIMHNRIIYDIYATVRYSKSKQNPRLLARG